MHHPFNDTKHVVQSYTSFVNIYCNSKTIINNALLYSDHIPILLHYLSCVNQVFSKYRLSFKLIKCVSFYLVLSMWDIIWQLVVTVRHNPSFNSLIIGLFHLIVYLFSPSLSYLLSTEIMSHGLNCLLNHFVVFNVYITVKCFQYLFFHPRSSNYSNSAKTTSLHYLFSSDILVQNHPF